MFSARLARFMQDLMQDLASIASKTLARLKHFLKDGFLGKTAPFGKSSHK